MHIFLMILLGIGILISLALIIALFLKKDYDIKSEIVINTNNDKVFNYLKHLKNQDNFNKWVMVEPDMKRSYKGIDGQEGFIYTWNGKKAGEGDLEIKKIVENQIIETEIRFVRPFVSIAYANYYTERISESTTRVSWTNKSEMKYPMNLLLPMLQKMLTNDMNTSLNNLKNLLEK